MFAATNIVKNSDKIRHVYSGYGTTFDGVGSWSFDNDFARNVIIFDVDNTSTCLTGNCKNNYLVLSEGPTDDINGNVSTAEKKVSITFSKTKTKLYLSLPYNGDNDDSIYLLLREKNSVQLYFGSISEKFDHFESKEVPFKGNVYDFSRLLVNN